MNQDGFNLLLEIAETLYEDANAAAKTLSLESADPITRRDIENKGHLHLMAAKICSDLIHHGGENIPAILEEGAKKGISLYHCDMMMNLPKIMPPP